MSTRVLPALIKPPVAPGGPPIITKVTRGSGSGSNPPIGVTLGTVSGPRLVLVGLYNKDGFGSAYAAGVAISGGPSLAENMGARFIGSRGSDDHRGQLFWIETAASGPTTFDVTLATSDTTQLVAIEMAGYNAADPLGAIIPAQANINAGLSQNITTTALDSLLVVFAGGEKHPANPGAGITTELNAEVLTDDVVYVGQRSAPTIASYPVALDFGDGNFNDGGGMWVAEVKAAA